MASATGTGNPEARPPAGRPRRFPGSRLGRLILGLNLLSLAIVVAGALVLNELRRGLVNARIDSLTTQGELIASILDQAATIGEPEPRMDAALAAELLQTLSNPEAQRARLFDRNGRVVADSEWMADRVDSSDLPPAAARPTAGSETREVGNRNVAAREALAREVATALSGEVWSGLRRGDHGGRVVSVSIPIRHVRAVLGVVTLEARDVDQIIAAERRALIPFVLIAMMATLGSSLLLNSLVAQPVSRMARAADRVRQDRARVITLPDLAKRDDEVGDLSRSLEAMTSALTERIGAIEAFAADVAHEIRNPLTSLRSAVETLDLVQDPAARVRLTEILKNDVQRLDRLVTDISNASRLDAELSRDPPRPVDLARLLGDIIGLYQETGRGQAAVTFSIQPGSEASRVMGREGPLSQIVRNLIDNARSFSPVDGTVSVTLARSSGDAVVTKQIVVARN